MPHIVAASYKEFLTPIKSDQFTFLWFAKPLKNAQDTLVAVEYEKRFFLLEIKQKGDHYVIKSDKITRISPLFLVKKALKIFCNLAECQVISDNLSSIKPTHAIKAEQFFKPIDFFLSDFTYDKELWIEIGFGSARHLLYQAQNHPHIQFIGIEIHKPSIEQALRHIALKQLENVFIVDYDARLFLEFIPSNKVGKIFVHFPVPWDKKPHRRVISTKFIQEAKRVLKEGGILELRTDSRLYFDYSLDLFLQEPQIDLEVTKNMELPVSSKYEDRWVRLGKDIYDIRMFVHEKSEEIDLDFDFSFKSGAIIKEIIENFNTQPLVFEDYFIHFQKLYQIDSQKLLIDLSLGNFDRPTHTYLIIEQENIRYFPKNPIPSKANILAHKKIEELLNA